MELYQEVISAVRGKKCWHVGCGGAVGTTFQLAIGEKVRRETSLSVLKMPFHVDYAPRDIDEYEGEIVLLVWCTWRLDDANAPVSSSDDTLEHVVDALKTLTDRDILHVAVDLPAWDLHLVFSGGLKLHVFCDHMPGDPSFRDNWEMALRDKHIVIGLGARIEVQPRTRS
ncbi:MAG: hypothetical protein ACLQNE_04530 [Thermoguttaceae bacterium]